VPRLQSIRAAQQPFAQAPIPGSPDIRPSGCQRRLFAKDRVRAIRP
jgi:hypothetical protein